eukprot:359394-Chlamydomonas_euryale.AAC.9
MQKRLRRGHTFSCHGSAAAAALPRHANILAPPPLATRARSVCQHQPALRFLPPLGQCPLRPTAPRPRAGAWWPHRRLRAKSGSLNTLCEHDVVDGALNARRVRVHAWQHRRQLRRERARRPATQRMAHARAQRARRTSCTNRRRHGALVARAVLLKLLTPGALGTARGRVRRRRTGRAMASAATAAAGATAAAAAGGTPAAAVQPRRAAHRRRLNA